jgi:agmatinase
MVIQTGKVHPRIVALGGDHSITLPILRAIHKTYGPVSVIHIDAHIDTWSPEVFAGAKGAPSEQAKYADGTPLYFAAVEGLISDTCVHAGIRSLLDSAEDLVTDKKSGFSIIPASDILESGPAGIVSRIQAAAPHSKPVYLSFDIDSLDPAFAPGTAGPASGGWSTREAIQIIIDGLKDLQIVGADIVEVLPGMDSPGEITSIAAAEITYEVISQAHNL